MAERIGCYVCECGPNISGALDIDELVNWVQGLKNVVSVRRVRLLCSKEGQEEIENDIRDHNLTRIVAAACSPKEHEFTFRKVLAKAGLNPFFLQVANIREQCAWVIKDKSLATEKAKVILRAAVERVVYHEPLEIREIECHPDVLVIGSGVAGLSAALTLAQKNRKVYLVEKLPCIGGKVARYEEVFPNLECASCMLDPVMDEVLHHENIEVLTYSELTEVFGFYGNFTVKIKRKARFVDPVSCIGCGACFEVCPVRVRNEYNEGIDERKAVYVPYAGSLPNVAVIDKDRCLRFQGKECEECRRACPFGSINYDDTDKVQELKVGAIVLAAGFNIFNPEKAPQYGYKKTENVYTSLEFERLLSSTGPTGGKLLLKDGRPPEKIAIVHCVGSRTEKFNEHCSGICCIYSLKFTRLAKKKLPDVSVTEFYSDFCLPGKESQSFFNKLAGEKGIEFLRMKGPDSIEITGDKDGILIKYTGVDGKSRWAKSDMVVLSSAVEGTADAGILSEVLDIPLGKSGFFSEGHSKLAPVSTVNEGLFIAGCVQGPKDIQGSVVQGQAAAGRVLSRLVPGEKLTLEPMTAVVDEDVCSGCKTCIVLCPYKAITYEDKEKQARINEVLCRGCGVCAAACPSGAIKARHFTDRQVFAEIRGLLK